MQTEAQMQESKITVEEKIKLVDGIRVMHPGFVTALSLIEETHNEGRVTNHPLSMLVYGDSGSGKTTVLETYLASNMHVEEIYSTRGKETRRNILHASISSPATYVGLTEDLLRQLGDRYPTKGTATHKRERLSELIGKYKVELIMLDELQHFVDRDKKQVVLRVSDFLKSLMNELKVPIVLFGLEDSMDVLKVNPQISRRVPTRWELKPFEYDDEFETFLLELDNQLLDVFEKQSHLSESDVAERLYYATAGVVNSIMLLVRRAAKSAIMKGRECIEMIDFAEAFERYAHVKSDKKVNPFLVKQFSLRDGA